MISYLSKGFKTGAFPTPSDDQLTIWARPHPKDATGGDPLGLPQSAFQVRMSTSMIH
jgi:glucan endo-1,3-alpha-glucosidase